MDIGDPEFQSKGKTGGLLLHLTKSIHNSARYVVLDLGFCVLSALIAIQNMGVFACALIKKRRFWPQYIFSDAIDNLLAGNNMGDPAAVEGYLDDTICNVWAMKKPDYTKLWVWQVDYLWWMTRLIQGSGQRMELPR
jgi:hypothetical protein